MCVVEFSVVLNAPPMELPWLAVWELDDADVTVVVVRLWLVVVSVLVELSVTSWVLAPFPRHAFLKQLVPTTANG